MARRLALVYHLRVQVEVLADLLQAHHLDAVSTQHKEVIVYAHLFHAKDAGKGLAQCLLHLIGGCHIVAL